MILLDNKADTFPCGLIGTPFEAVYKALRVVAADVWAVDPTVYRAGMAWGWYALHRPEKLAGFRDVVAAALVSSFAPLVKDTQTDAELVEYLRQWRDYTPTFGRLQALYALFGATVDIQPITDPESQAVLPVDDTRLAFYVRITEVDFSRPLSLDDAREIALRATPLGSRPYVYYALESRTQIPVAAIPQAPEVFVDNWEIAQPAAPPVPLGDFILVDSLGNVIYSVETLTEIEFTPTGYFTIDEGNEVILVEQSPFPVVCIDEGTRTPESIAPNASFDTELPYYASKLYIVTTDDGQDDTLYGWGAEEGTPGPVLPNVGDTVTFGNYPQATSTPEPIEWTVLAVDSVNGKALLISKYILDAHVYNAEKVSVSWATCTLRDWLNDTFYNAAFNSEEQSGIVTTHNAGSGLSSDDKVFCLTQDESASYIPVEADRRAVATRKAIDDGVSAQSEDKYGNWWNLDWDVDSYYRVDMISASGGLSSAQITITWMGVRPALWLNY